MAIDGHRVFDLRRVTPGLTFSLLFYTVVMKAVPTILRFGNLNNEILV